MKSVILDCDNTLGLPGAPMDDAMALMYLLGNPEQVRLLGVCSCYGNASAGEVYTCNRKLLAELGREDIPILRGSEPNEDPRNESAAFLVQASKTSDVPLTYIGIGSLTNLYGAYLLDPDIFQRFDRIVLMGGVTEPLVVAGKPMAELNFSVNTAASFCVLRNAVNVSVITGNSCLGTVFLPKAEFTQRLCAPWSAGGEWIAQKCGYRLDTRISVYGEAGTYCWDVLAAAYAIHPELFEPNPSFCAPTEESLKTGFLAPTEGGQGRIIELPQARSAAALKDDIYAGWRRLRLPNSLPSSLVGP